jgi:hypothetical protein
MKTAMAKIIVILVMMFGVWGTTGAAVISFDDLSATRPNAVPDGYAGLTWGTSNDNNYSASSPGYWAAYALSTYATAKSSPNYVFNVGGVNNLWFAFATPVTFNGAWFSQTNLGSYSAEQVRFRDDLGDLSSWLSLSNTPQYLEANFSGAQTIYVERKGQLLNNTGSLWFAMDDITYNTQVPEPTTMLLLGLGLVGLAGLRRKL